ncbi:MAG: Pla-1/cef family extracellular lipase [Phenylobacterium sp.]|jgi:Pla-1/cef family extracellular lipase
MKKLILSIPIAVAMGLSGCGDKTTLQDLNDEVATNNSTVIPMSRVVFDPTGGKLSVPNDLLFSGTTDGTLEMPAEVAGRAGGAMPDYSNPSIGLGMLDGWSTQNPFVLALDFPAGYSLDAASASAPGAVRIFEVQMGATAGCEEVPRGAACAPVAELTFGVDFVTSASGNSVAVAPLHPLKPETTYIVALTDTLRDTNASGSSRSIGPSSTYELVRRDINTLPLATPSQLALQGVINSFEGVLAAGFGVDTDTVIYTSAMTTQSVGKILGTIKTMMAANMSLNPAATPRVDVSFTGTTVADKMVELGALSPDSPSLPAFSAALLYEGNVTLPYYLGVPTPTNPLAPVNTAWRAACDSGVMVAGYAAQVGDSYPYDPATTAPLSQNDGMCIALSGGQLRDFTNPETGFGIDKERHLTKYNVIPQIRAMDNVDVQMTIPEINTVNFIRVNVLGLDPIAMPEAGWPVVILQHGITSRKEDMLSITANLALAGFATTAIDLALHSSRGFDVNGDGVDDINATTVSPTHYMNLSNLASGRDNLRQSAADLMGLRLGLNFAQNVDLDTSRVYALGLSLGAISASTFLAVTNTRTLDVALGLPEGAPSIDDLFKVNAGVLASPGGGIASLLVDSPAFGPIVQGSVLSGSGTALSAEFNAFLATPGDQCDAFAASQDSYLGCKVQVFLFGLSQAGDVAKLASFKGSISAFIFAAQAIIDGGDPSSFGSMLAANGTPLLVTELIGDGMENLSDQVIPNQSSSTPIGGTEPLIRALGLAGKSISNSTLGEIDENGMPGKVSGVIRFTKGHHSSVVNPGIRSEATEAISNQRVTQEMQSQAVSYFSSNGTAVLVTDGEFVQGN